MTSTRSPRIEPADAVRSGIPLLVLLAAVALPGLAWIFAAALVAGAAVAAGRRVPVAWSWAAMVPAGVIAVMRTLEPAMAGAPGTGCALLTTPAVPWSAAELVLVIAVTATLAGLLRATAGDLAIRWPAKAAVRLAVTGAAILLGGGLAAVVVLSQPAFGFPALDLGGPAFLLPAVVFAIARGVGEELAWRGALLRWLGRMIGPWPAVVGQAAVYGVAWGVALGSPLWGVIAGAAGLLAGMLVVRTRSLLVPIAWHVALNVPLYALLACGA
jgi:membrane protease YdiL (CAAX protease family)